MLLEERQRGAQRRNRPPRRRRVDTRARVAAVGLMVFCLFAALFARLWYLQVMAAPRLKAAAVSNGVRQVSVQAPRGEVVDRTGQVLVGNDTTLGLTAARSLATPTPAHQAVINRLASLLGRSPASLAEALNSKQVSPYQPVPIAANVGMPVVLQILEHKDLFPGVTAEDLSQRAYPQGQLAAQVLGYDGPISPAELNRLKGQGYHAGDIVGLSGVERAYDQYLRGIPGTTNLQVSSQGQVLGSSPGTPAIAGDTVQLSLDLPLQQQVESDLTNEINTLRSTYDPMGHTYYPATDGAALVLDPRNGQVLAMASYPSYNPSVWVGGISNSEYAALTNPASGDPLDNRAIFGSWAPGSTFKLATATAALDDGILTPNTVIVDPGSFTFPDCTGSCPVLHNSTDNEALGPLTVSEALTASDDVFFYNVGYDFYAARGRLGLEAIQNVAHDYGLGEPTQFALGDSNYAWVDSPTVRQKLHAQAPNVYPNYWYAADNVEMAFGQGLTVVTPLQLADAYAAFANGGTVWQPQIAAQVVNHAGQVVTTIAPRAISHVPLPPVTYQTILSGLEGAVQSGGGTATATFAGFPFSQMSVAGKTGTATGSTANVEPTSWFVCFAPTTNTQYVVAVVIDQAGYGASGSAPVARQILQYLVSHPVGGVQASAPPPNS